MVGESSAVRVVHVVRPLTGAEKNGGAEVALKVKQEGTIGEFEFLVAKRKSTIENQLTN